MLGLPIFRKTSLQGPTGTIQSFSSYDRQIRHLGHYAGCEVKTPIHDARREALVEADDKFSLPLCLGHSPKSSNLEKIMATRLPKG